MKHILTVKGKKHFLGFMNSHKGTEVWDYKNKEYARVKSGSEFLFPNTRQPLSKSNIKTLRKAKLSLVIFDLKRKKVFMRWFDKVEKMWVIKGGNFEQRTINRKNRPSEASV